MSRMISVKTVGELPVEFKQHIEFQVTDNAIEAVILKLDGKLLRIVKSSAYSENLKVLIEQPKKEVIKYKLSGTVGGLVMQPEVFGVESDAEQKKYEYERKFNFNDTDLRIEEFSEFVDEDKI